MTDSMPIELSHIGEHLVKEMICELGQEFLDLCEGFQGERVEDPIAVVEATLERYGGAGFDGKHCVDVLVLLKNGRGIPFEVKLGSTRLSRGRIERNFLKECSKPKGVWCGNMMSILDRRFPLPAPARALFASVKGGPTVERRRVELTENWFIIARKKVIDRLRIGGDLSPKVGYIAFESIVEKCVEGDEPLDKFNRLVRRLLDFNYYKHWISPKND